VVSTHGGFGGQVMQEVAASEVASLLDALAYPSTVGILDRKGGMGFTVEFCLEIPCIQPHGHLRTPWDHVASTQPDYTWGIRCA